MGRNKLIESALDKAYEQLDDYSFMEIIYALITRLGVSNAGKLLEMSYEEVYEAIFEMIRFEKEEDFTEDEIKDIRDNIIKFNATKRWKRSQ